jgi:hypothetical protein
MADKLVEEHETSVWGRDLGAQPHLKAPNDKKMHIRNRFTWEVGIDQKRYVWAYEE